MKAIILAGGFGTRLQAVLPHVPKPMAPIHDKPFLAYLLQYLKAQGFTTIIFSVHYLREQIQNYFQTHYLDMDIHYAIEETPLGTGGAMVNSLLQIQTNEPIFILNGDTFVKLDYQAMFLQHQKSSTSITMALRSIEDCSRYGKVMIEKNTVIEFKEKGEAGPGLINAGVYLVEPNIFTHFKLSSPFSFEQDFLLSHLVDLKPQAFMTNHYFIDIGIPEDYARAQREWLSQTS